MYRKNDLNQMSFEDFYLPFGGKLRSDNRWVLLSKQILWSEVEKEYIVHFSEDDTGSPAKSSRMAFGALILKERLGVTDRELVEQIVENPYLQYFLGLSAYQNEAPFHDSMLTHFRKRFSQKSLAKINESIALKAEEIIDRMYQLPGKPKEKTENLPSKNEKGLSSGLQGKSPGQEKDEKGHRQASGLLETKSVIDIPNGRSRPTGSFEEKTIQTTPHHQRTLSAAILDVPVPKSIALKTAS